MLFAPLAALAATIFSAAGIEAADWKTDKAASSPFVVKGKYIVEYSSDASRKRGVDVHTHFDSHMRRADVPYEVTSTFDAAGLFVGASIALADGDVEAVRNMPSVQAVYPVKVVPRPRPYNDVVNVIAGPASNPTDTYVPHRQTGVDKLHNMGIYGKGVYVAIIDTGIDYTHPALGNGCFGAGCKVVNGYDFVGDDYTGSNAPVPDNDPMDCGGHGSHVAGIVAADMNPLNFTGVAPQASLGAYRVFGCTGSSQNDVIMEAMIRAFNDGADIISMSLGGASGWTEDPEAILASRLVDQGVVMSLANGNDGSEGLFYSSAPATAIGSLAVASIESLIIPAMPVVIGGKPYLYTSESLTVDKTPLPIYVSSPVLADSSNLGCDPYGPEVDLQGKVTIVVRGSCAFALKAQNVADAGGDIMLIVNNAPGTLSASIGDVDIQVATLLQADGPAIFASIQTDTKTTASFPGGYVNFENKETAGLVSDFSTFGLTNDVYLKPSVGAPGGNILSTYPVAKGSYAVLSGTSMATPFLSGVAALFIGQNGKVDPDLITKIFETTTTPVYTQMGGSQLQTIAQQGGGLINAYDAVLFKTIISPAEFNLNDTVHAVTSGQVTIDNTGSAAVSYRISHVAAPAALTFGSNGAQPNPGSAVLVDGAATVSFEPAFVTVAAGASANVAVTFAAPTGLDSSSVPIYSGHIHIESSDGAQKFNIPYAGVAASMKDDYPMLDTTSEYFEQIYGYPVDLPVLMDKDGNLIEGPTNFTGAAGDAPEIFYRLLGGTPKLQIDLVEASSTFSPSITTRRSLLNNRRMLHKVKRALPAEPTVVGSLSTETYFSRNIPTSAKNGQGYFNYPISASETGFSFANGSQVPDGSYKVLVRALKIFGDDTKAADYESWLSPVITINAAVAPSGNTTVPDPQPEINASLPIETLPSNATSTPLPISNATSTALPMSNLTTPEPNASNSTSGALP